MKALLVASRSDADAGGWRPVGRLDYDHGVYRFVYTKGARKAKGFTPFSGMEDLEAVYESVELFPVFANRLLPKSRPEYEAFLRWSGFDPANAPEPLAILGVTEGIKPTDMIEVFPCPVPDAQGCYFTRFFLHGLRYMPATAIQRIAALKEDEELSPMLDIANPTDRRAVALRTMKGDRVMIGYVPRYLAQDFWGLMEGCGPQSVQMFVHRVNRDAPLQQRLLCRVHACWPVNFQPCSGEEFEPIPDGVPARCES
jgi:hypothetical protein